MTTPTVQYRIKNVTIGKRSTPIILQNYNGPCPLIAVANSLLLKGQKLGLDANQKFVSNDHLVQILGSYLLEYNPSKDDSEPTRLNIQEALEILPKIKDGLDVNVRFTGIREFESRPEVELFNLLRLNLVHGWLIDPQDVETASVLGNLTYNQVIEKYLLMEDLIAAESKEEERLLQQNTIEVQEHLDETKNQVTNNDVHEDISSGVFTARTASDIGELIKSPDELRNLNQEQKSQIIREGRIIGEFLEREKSQLTVYGLNQLHEGLKPNNLCILFRNNHFSTVCKYTDGHLYQLCTDEGFYDEPNVVWERISEVLGDNQLFKGDFTPYNFDRHASNKTVDAINAIKQTNDDYELALQLQREEDIRDLKYFEEQEQLQQQHLQQCYPPQYSYPPQPLNSQFSNTRQPIQIPSQAQQQQQQQKQHNNNINNNNTGVLAPTRIESIREKRNLGTKHSSKANNPQKRYQNQAKQLEELNLQRQMRSQQSNTQVSQHDHRTNHSHKKKDDDACSIM
jgi:hypothetical protein